MKDEIYDFEGRLKWYKQTIAKLRNGDMALRLLDHLASLGLSPAGLSNYAAHLLAVLRLVDFDVADAKRSDVERVVAKINSCKDWRENTKYHKRVVLRKLVQYAKYGSCERGAPVPPEVSWIKLTKRQRDSRVTPEALLAREEFEALVKAADNPRDRAMVYTLFEGALRPGELLSMSVGSVEFKQGYCLITVNGKTGLKRIPLVLSYKPLLEWVKVHPKANDLDAPLWCSLAVNYKGERLSYRHFRLIIKRLAKNSGLRKGVWPYLFRHSTLTAMAKVLTEAKLEQFAGWVHGSGMSRRYVHFSARDLEDAVLELYGLKPAGERYVPLKPVKCPRCGEGNPPGAARCDNCGLILDKDCIAKLEEEEKRREEQVKELTARLEEEKKAFEQLAGIVAGLVNRIEKMEAILASAGQGAHRAPSPSHGSGKEAPQRPSSASQAPHEAPQSSPSVQTQRHPRVLVRRSLKARARREG